MKISILTIVFLFAGLIVVATPLHAEHKWLMTTPELLVSVGGSVGQDHEAYSIKFTAQETLCYTAKYFCLNPSVMWLVEESDDPKVTDAGDKINIGAGLDIKYIIPKSSNNAVYVEAGPVAFVKDLDGHSDQRVNLHIGTGVEHHGFTLSVDAYGTDSADNTLFMVGVGYRF